MADKRNDWVDQLIEAEPADAGRLEALRKEIGAVVEQKWSPAKRVFSLVGGVFLIVLATGSGIAMLTGNREQPPLIRAAGVISLLVCVAMGVLMIWLARRGVFHRRKHNQVYMLLAVVVLGGLGLVFLNEGWASDDARLQFTGQLMFALLGFSIILHFMEQYQLSLTQRLLELELRIAQMDDNRDSRDGGRGGPQAT